jgi:hypothetical protein
MKLNKIYSFALAILAGINMLGAQATLPAFWNCNDPAGSANRLYLESGYFGHVRIYFSEFGEEYTSGDFVSM